MLIALAVGAIAGGMAFKNNISLTTDIASLYDVSVHNPTADEKKILNKIKFEEKANYRYKVDQKFVYYLKEDLEKIALLFKMVSGKRKSVK
ncbi:hypothetical protein AAHH72_27195 [Bacillus cereus]